MVFRLTFTFHLSHCIHRKTGKEEYLYGAFYILCISQSAQSWITQFYLQIHHACLSFVSVHQMAPPLTAVRDIQLQLTTHLSTPKGWKKNRNFTVCDHELWSDLNRRTWPTCGINMNNHAKYSTDSKVIYRTHIAHSGPLYISSPHLQQREVLLPMNGHNSTKNKGKGVDLYSA